MATPCSVKVHRLYSRTSATREFSRDFERTTKKDASDVENDLFSKVSLNKVKLSMTIFAKGDNFSSISTCVKRP